MDAYRVNPPLPRMVATLPLLLDRPNVDWHYSESPYARNEYQFAHRWVSDNPDSLPRLLFWVRSTVLMFFGIGLWSIVRWASRMYGTCAGCLAGATWSLNPDVITNAAVVAPDLPAAATGLAAGYFFWDWLGRPNRPFPWTVATVVALAILCKFSWLFLLPTLPLLTLLNDLWKRRWSSETDRSNAIDSDRETSSKPWRDTVRLTLSFSLTALIINWCYGFDGTGTRLGHFEFISHSLAGQDLAMGATGNRFESSLLGSLPMPLPAEMIRGIDYLKWEFENGMQCYLRGEWKHRGWWYFYLYAMAVKMPLGYWLLIGLGAGSLIWDRFRQQPRSKLEWLPLLMAVMFIALISSQTGFTHHVRYVLPAYGFLFIVASRTVVVFPKRVAVTLVAICLSGTLWFHATHLGLAHTFFNPLAGGPNNGWRHLSFSNVDWGQSTYRMVDWVKEHPEQRPMTVLFRSSLGSPEQLIAEQPDVFTSASWRQAKNDHDASPTRPGYYLISSYQMTLPRNRFFWDVEPVDQPCPDMLLFYLSEDEVAGVRSQ